ncbi:universal stress protein, partial [Vibrio parahaemolyticus]|nr:universal stress protein [Vibrio parahaemolyticus]NMR96748.1 universal stress protein [Vibrio parahaemolyticus]
KELGELYHAELIILTVIDNGRFFSIEFKDELIKILEQNAKELLQNAKNDLSDYPYGVKTVFKFGDVPGEIIDTADEEDVDLIVIGTRGLGAFQRAVLGGVSHKVVTHADRSVLVVK